MLPANVFTLIESSWLVARKFGGSKAMTKEAPWGSHVAQTWDDYALMVKCSGLTPEGFAAYAATSYDQ